MLQLSSIDMLPNYSPVPTRLPPQGEHALASHLIGHRIEIAPATPRGHPGSRPDGPGQAGPAACPGCLFMGEAVRPPRARAGEAVGRVDGWPWPWTTQTS